MSLWPKKSILGGQNIKKYTQKILKISKNYKKMQIDQISIKFFCHKHNTLPSCHVIIDGRYIKSHFGQKKSILGGKNIKNRPENA